MEVHANDLTKGNILGKLLHVAIPIMGTQLMQMAYNLTDMFWLGRSEHSVMAVAASGLAGMYLWLGMAFLMVGRMGAEIGSSQNLGRGDKLTARDYSLDSSRISILLGVLYGGILFIFATPLVKVLQVQDPIVFDNTRAYLRIVGLGEPFAYLAAAITGSFNGAGNSRLGFTANAVGLGVNMILDPIMIFYFNMGVRGAAWATIIAQAVVCILFVAFAKHHKKRPFDSFTLLGKIDRERFKQIFRWSLPISLESAAFTLLAMVVTAMVTSLYGEKAVAIQRVGSQVESLSWLIGGGFSSAVTAFIGQNYGAGKWTRIRRGYKIALSSLIVWETMAMFIFIFGGRFLFSVFLRDSEEILDMGATYLKILAICQIFMAFEGACAGTFRGIGQTLAPSVSSIAANLSRPFLCWFLAQRIGLNGFWLGIALSASLRGLIMLIWYTLYQRGLPIHDEENPAPVLMTT